MRYWGVLYRFCFVSNGTLFLTEEINGRVPEGAVRLRNSSLSVCQVAKLTLRHYEIVSLPLVRFFSLYDASNFSWDMRCVCISP